MLVLSRRLNQKIVFPGIQTTVQIVAVKPGIVRLGIEAPDQVAVLREELWQKNVLAAMDAASQTLPPNQASESMHLLNNLLNANTVGLALLRRQIELGQIGEMNSTLDKIESNFRNVQERAGRLEVDRPRVPGSVKRRALVVEDDCNQCELLAGFLRLAGLDVHTAGDGAAALDYLNFKGKPDFMLLDMFLPRCDGPATVRAIRGNPAFAGLRIFGVSGSPIEQFELDQGPGGIDHWFRKPINLDLLLRELDQGSAPRIGGASGMR